MTDETVQKQPYATSSDAYRAIHAAIAYWIEAGLEGCDGETSFDEAIRLAERMRQIEEHTDVD